jgi:hypothetical protein
VKEGMSSVMERLSNELKIELNSVVNSIEYSNKGISVKYIKQETHQETTKTEIHTLKVTKIINQNSNN